VIIPSTVDASQRSAAWPLSSALPPMGAMLAVPAIARAHVAVVLTGWHLAPLAEVGELVTSELVTNAVEASTDPDGRPVYVLGRMPVVRVAILSDGVRVLIEVFDQAPGRPMLKRVDGYAEAGRGLFTINALSSQWGWHPVQGQHFKCVWAELTVEASL
jgi:anti-sigma regulatory factor (Ser/Thr protein kinase)